MSNCEKRVENITNASIKIPTPLLDANTDIREFVLIAIVDLTKRCYYGEEMTDNFNHIRSVLDEIFEFKDAQDGKTLQENVIIVLSSDVGNNQGKDLLIRYITYWMIIQKLVHNNELSQEIGSLALLGIQTAAHNLIDIYKRQREK